MFYNYFNAFIVLIFSSLALANSANASLRNGDFTAGDAHWTFGQYGGAASGLVVDGQFQLIVSKPANAWWNIQLTQGGQKLLQHKRYRFKFDAYKGPENSGTQQLSINIGQASGAYASYLNLPNTLITLSTTNKTYVFDFEMTAPSDAAARLEFNVGQNTGSVYLDNISLEAQNNQLPKLQVSTTALTYTSTAVGQIKTQEILLTNPSQHPLNITHLVSNTADFNLDRQSPLVIAAGASQRLKVAYRPSQTGKISGELLINSDAEDNPLHTIALTGSGSLAGLEPNKNRLALSLKPETHTTTQLTLTNTSEKSIAWQLSTLTTWVGVLPAGGILASHASQSIAISVNAASLAHGTYTAPLTLTNKGNAEATTLNIPLNIRVAPGYQPKSAYLLDPSLFIPWVRETAHFRKRARDDVQGGFFTDITRHGYSSGADIKSLNVHSRLAYAFTRAFQLTGDDTYLDDAHHALNFLYEHGWQNGWHFVTNLKGTPLTEHWGQSRWWSFQQHYALLGIGTMVEATGGEYPWGDKSESDLTWLNRGINSNYERLWDATPGKLGYFEFMNHDWTTGTGKGFTPTCDAITTHAALLGTLYNNPKHEQRLRNLADNIVNHLAAAATTAKVGFPEYYDENWKPDASKAEADIGHLYKTAWVLQRVYLQNPQRDDYRKTANSLLRKLWQDGTFDTQFGGPYATVNWQTGVITSTIKNHWKLEQGFNSGMASFYTADTQKDKDVFLEIADGSINFYMTHMRDIEAGDTWTEVNQDGTVVTDPDKGGLFTAGYHSIELGFYGYLYGNLFYHQKPVTLYYKYPKTAKTRHYQLTPIDIQDNQLVISAVELDGQPYKAFNGVTRTLQLAANVGGIFKVTFERKKIKLPVAGRVAPNLL